jgi:hypothetical protein
MGNLNLDDRIKLHRRFDIPRFGDSSYIWFPTLCCVLARDVYKMAKMGFSTFLREQKGIFRHLLTT